MNKSKVKLRMNLIICHTVSKMKRGTDDFLLNAFFFIIIFINYIIDSG